MVRRRLTIALVAALWWGAAAAPAAAETVPVRAAPHDGYGRIVFGWPSPVRYDAAIAEGRLVVRFSRPIEADYGGIVRILKNYLRSAKSADAGRTVVFDLAGPFYLRRFDLGSAVIVDLLDSLPAEGVTPGGTAAGRGKRVSGGGTGTSVAIRAGEHRGYSRMVFDWPRTVPYRVSHEGTNAIVSFDGPGIIDLGGLSRRPLRYIRGVGARRTEGTVSVSFSMPESSRLRHFRAGPKVVLDVMAPTARETAAPSAAASVTAEAPPPAVLAPLALEPVAAAPPPEPAPAGKGVRGTERPVSLIPPESKGDVREAKPAAKAPRKVPVLGRPPAPVPVAAAGTHGDPRKPVVLRFDWTEPVAAAVFRRGGWLWVIFDKPTRQNPKLLRVQGRGLLRDVEQVPARAATILRMKTAAGVNPEIKRDGLTWILELHQQALKAETPIEIKSQPFSALGARLFLPIGDPGDAIVLRDSEVGDNLVVIPVIPLGQGVKRRHEYPQVRLLPTAQGIVVEPRIDDLRVRVVPQGVEVTSVGNMQISPVSVEVALNAKLGVTRALSRVFNLPEWSPVPPVEFVKAKQNLQRTVATASDEKREETRLALARFYFANRRAAETLGVLRWVVKDRPAILDEPEFRALRGASRFLMYRYGEAQKDLQHASLDGIDEATFWRAAVRAADGDLVGAAPDLERSGSVISPYPKALKMPLGMLMTEAAVEAGDIERSTAYLNILNLEQPNPAQKAQLDFIEGRLKELEGEFDEAVGKLEDAIDGPHPPTRARAAAARTELLLNLDKITRAEAITELERLRFAWRGDDFEFRQLRRLGQLYVDEGDYRNGLRTLRQAATHFRKHRKAPEVTEEMANIFIQLYLEGGADSLPPITAIALYDEFRELTPAGPKGDEMIRKLADRLVSVDLLDRAIKLLDAQVRFRLKGKEKSRVGAQLALVHILDRQPENALKVLDETRMEGIGEDLAGQRRHLRARALVGLGRAEEALVLLAEDRSMDAELLRADIHWEGRDWPNAAKVLRRVIREFGARPGQPLDGKQARYVLNLAVALTLSGREAGLARLRADYAKAMDDSPYKSAFRLIATPDAAGLIDYRSIASKVADVENFQAFMTAYRERLRNQKLSAIN